MYKLKNALKRGSALLGAVGFVAGIGTSVLPAVASADALNPLTERSLTLSSSSPGWSYLDGSGNITYAPPHSGANGQKTGETFSFRMSSFSKTVKAMTFQFCTSPAGNCIAPGNNTTVSSTGDTLGTGTGTITVTNGDDAVTGSGTNFDGELNVGSRIVTAGGEVYTVASITDDTNLTLTANASGSTETGVAFQYREADTSSTSDLNVTVGSGPTAPTEIEDVTDWPAIRSSADKTPNPDGSEGNFVVLYDAYNGAPAAWTDYSQSTGWSMDADNDETGTFAAGTATEKNNMITITNSTGQLLDSNPGDYFKIIFFGTDDNYITNPGAGAFFVRMNTYSSDTLLDAAHLIDGGVTVANVMNESITIQTKVLETMDFSVGTHDPDMYTSTQLTTVGRPALGQCNSLLMANPTGSGITNQATYDAQPHNVLQLGDPNAEYSLRTDTAYDVNSFWRLSSNSSGGATVYYTGHTLTNTVGDEIAPLDETAGGTASNTGTEQFGLAITHGSQSLNIGPGNSSVESYPVVAPASFAATYGDEDAASGDGDFGTFLADAVANSQGDDYVHYPRLYPLIPQDPYDDGAGVLTTSTPKFAFNANADSYAVPIATESDQVVNCVTAKMRYVANIAATTPAGIYTTKINYVASPQY